MKTFKEIILERFVKFKDINGVKSKDDAEKILAKNNIKWDKTDDIKGGSIMYELGHKSIAIWYNSDKFLRIYK